MRRTKEEATQTRQELLDAALRVFGQRGYQATRLQDIAEAAGVTRGAIYHHFGSKAELYTALVQEASAQGNEIVGRAISEGGSFIEVIRRLFVYQFTALEEERRLRDVLALTRYKTGVSEELAAVEQMRREQASQTVEMTAGFMRLGIEQGELRPDLDPLTAGRALIAYQDGIAGLWLVDPEAFSIKESAPALADLFLQGIAA